MYTYIYIYICTYEFFLAAVLANLPSSPPDISVYNICPSIYEYAHAALKRFFLGQLQWKSSPLNGMLEVLRLLACQRTTVRSYMRDKRDDRCLALNACRGLSLERLFTCSHQP